MKLQFKPNPASGIIIPFEITASGGPYQLVRGSLQGFGGAKTTHMHSQTPFQNGSTFYTSRYNDRELSFKFRVFADSFDDAQQKKREIADVFSAAHGLGTMRIFADVEDTVFFDIECVPSGTETMFEVVKAHDDTMFEATVELVAFSPFFYDPTLYQVEFSAFAGGFRLPFTYPFTLGVTGSGLVQNDGSSPTPAVITISGPFTNPVLTNERTGETISVKYTLSAGEKLIINTDPQNTAVVFVDAGGTRYAAFNAVTSDSAFWQLLPGENIIHYADSGVIGNVPIRIEWYDRYAGVF